MIYDKKMKKQNLKHCPKKPLLPNITEKTAALSVLRPLSRPWPLASDLCPGVGGGGDSCRPQGKRAGKISKSSLLPSRPCRAGSGDALELGFRARPRATAPEAPRPNQAVIAQWGALAP